MLPTTAHMMAAAIPAGTAAIAIINMKLTALPKVISIREMVTYRKAEKLISKGQRIRIIKESDFKELVNHS